MTEITGELKERRQRLLQFCLQIMNADNPVQAVEQNRDVMDTVSADEVIWVVDELVKQEIPMNPLKSGINKILNLFYNTLNNTPDINLPEKSFLDYLQKNNAVMDEKLKSIKPLVRRINKEPIKNKIKNTLKEKFESLLPFDNHYIIKENILFPLLEKYWKDYRCVQVMWSFHDDIRRNIKKIIQLVENEKFDLAKFNYLAGLIFFNMHAIKFREEKILFPQILKTISTKDLNRMLKESLSLDWPYVKPAIKTNDIMMTDKNNRSGEIDLETGLLFPEQIKIMLNHLPVDITYVDEHNKVRYFSSPKKRIFPRSKSIIGREVKNCHPPESVHVVEQIVEAFRKGEKNQADFWINMKNETILIQYFAVRDEQGHYKGVIEVSQEISGIQSLTGEKRLLDWE
ncbi:MAG TPA: PAS domain-containing protein [Bacteroidales bacterium]|nr:PAS domain-containing protein [Bacteroidales bacterium]